MKSKLFLILCSLLWCSTSWSQDTQEKQSLISVLQTLEKQHGYTFNYAQATVSDILVSPPSATLSFKESITYLGLETNLNFSFLENNIVTILEKNGLTLCGFLRDRNTSEPLTLASIQGENQTAISDEQGYFKLEVRNRNEEISIRFLGYKPLKRKYYFFNTQNCSPIYLTSQEESLSQIILANYLVEGINKLETGTLEVNFDKFGLLPGLIEADVLQSIQALPGVQSVNETVSNINIRGGTNDQNLVLWDDIKMYQTGHFFGLISAFNPQITKKVSLQKNGTSAAYSDGVSGTISMHTDERINIKTRASLGLNLIDANVFVDLPISKNSSLQIAGRKAINGLIRTPTYEEYFSRISQDTEVESNMESVLNTDQSFDFYDTSLRWLYRISEKDILRLNFIYINNELLFTENATVNQLETARESSIRQNSVAGGLYYEHSWNKKHKTSLQIYETDYKLKAVNANLFESQRFLQENKVSETGVLLKSSLVLSKQLVLHAGYQFLETEITNLDDVDVPIIRTLISEVVRAHSGFSELSFRSKDQNTTINTGLRYNYLDKFQEHIVEPRFSINQKFANFFSAEIAAEYKHQIESQIVNFQNDFLGVEKRRWQLSNNEDIPIIKSSQYSLALNYNSNGWLLGIEGYYKDVKGITSQSQEFQNQYEFVKTLGNYTVFGTDFLLRKRIVNASFWLSYSFMDNEYTFEGLAEKTFPSNLDITHTVSLGSSYVYKKLKLSAGFNWHTGKPTTTPIAGSEILDGEINFGPTNSTQLADYFRVDTSVLYRFMIGNLEADVGASVWNVLDAENEINNYYRINDANQVEEFVQTSLGLTPHALLRVFF